MFFICVFTDKPDCTITRRELNGDDTLVCTADGNPAKVFFIWEKASVRSSWKAITNNKLYLPANLQWRTSDGLRVVDENGKWNRSRKT